MSENSHNNETISLVSDHLNLKIERQEGCKVSLSIQVDKQSVEACYQKACKLVNKEISLPGFRKGRAPVELILQKFSAPIEQEWRELVVNTAFREAIKLSSLYPYKKDSVTDVTLDQLSREEGACMKVCYECQPDIPDLIFEEIDYQPVVFKNPSENDRRLFIDNLRIQNADISLAGEREVQEGDIILVEAFREGLFSSHLLKNDVFVFTADSCPKWIYDALKGKKAGDLVQAYPKIEENFYLPYVKDETEPCTISFVVYEGKLPDVDEAFIDKFKCKNLDEFNEKTTNMVLMTRRKSELERKQRELEEVIGNLYDFDIPSSLYESTVQQAKQQQARLLKQKENWQENFDQEIADFEEKARKEFKRSICRYFVLHKFANQNQITVSEQELTSRALFAGLRTNSVDEIDEKQISMLYNELLREKTLEYLINKLESYQETSSQDS